MKAWVPRSFIERGGLVTNWGSCVADSVAEHALLLALAALRNLKHWDRVIRGETCGNNTLELGTRTLFGRRVGIHGFGAVARALIRLLRPFQVSISAYSQGVPSRMFQEWQVNECGSIRELFSKSEVVFECEGLTPATKASVGANEIVALPDGAVFVNVGRGLVVDEETLVREAAKGRIRLALDVVSHEPLTPQNPVYSAKDAILSPHIAGPTRDLYPRIGEQILHNLRRFLKGTLPASPVTLEVYDRST